jgi:hypothetical protein
VESVSGLLFKFAVPGTYVETSYDVGMRNVVWSKPEKEECKTNMSQKNILIKVFGAQTKQGV